MIGHGVRAPYRTAILALVNLKVYLQSKKRKQHYVWRHYLKAWANENDLLYCLRENKIFRPNIMGIAQSRDFYRLKELTLYEINLIKIAFVENSPKHLKSLNAEWISIFNEVFEAREKLESHKMLDAQWNEFIDTATNNLEEDFHALIESQSTKYLALLRNEDTLFVSTNDYIDFLHFLSVQYFRTNKMRSNLSEAAEGSLENINIEAVWSVSKHILATNVAWNLYSRRGEMKLYLLKNTTPLEFVAGDQPVVNTYATGTPNGQLVDNLELYYPLSPNLAILLSSRLPEENCEAIELSEQDVITYNEHIFKNSHSQVYSASANTLERFLE